MSEPIALIAIIHIKEDALKSFLRKKSPVLDGHKNIDVLASLLHSCENNSGNVFLFHFENDILFTSYWLNHYHTDTMKPFKLTLKAICEVKEAQTDYAFLSDASKLLLETYEMENQSFKQLSKPKQINLLDEYWSKFWSFSQNNDFPTPAKALGKRNYFYKPLKTAYKRYLKRVEEIEKPLKIKNATKDKPFTLLEDFISYDEKVFYNDTFRNQIVAVVNADPYTFGLNGFWADKNYLYGIRVIGKHTIVNKLGWKVNNPNTKIEFFIMKDIDPLTFTWIKERWDTIYWKDKNHIYIQKVVNEQKLFYTYYQKVPNADVKSFDYLDFVFGKDKNYIYCYDKVLPINLNNYQMNEYGFLWGDEAIFHYDNAINIDAKTFQFQEVSKPQILGFRGIYILMDKNGKYEYNAQIKSLKRI